LPPTAPRRRVALPPVRADRGAGRRERPRPRPRPAAARTRTRSPGPPRSRARSCRSGRRGRQAGDL